MWYAEIHVGKNLYDDLSYWDRLLIKQEALRIHIKLMEVNYNADW